MGEALKVPYKQIYIFIHIYQKPLTTTSKKNVRLLINMFGMRKRKREEEKQKRREYKKKQKKAIDDYDDAKTQQS